MDTRNRRNVISRLDASLQSTPPINKLTSNVCSHRTCNLLNLASSINLRCCSHVFTKKYIHYSDLDVLFMLVRSSRRPAKKVRQLLHHCIGSWDGLNALLTARMKFASRVFNYTNVLPVSPSFSLYTETACLFSS